MNYVPDMNRVRNCSAGIISSRREVVHKKGGPAMGTGTALPEGYLLYIERKNQKSVKINTE
jgi:hypothetical protein